MLLIICACNVALVLNLDYETLLNFVVSLLSFSIALVIARLVKLPVYGGIIYLVVYVICTLLIVT